MAGDDMTHNPSRSINDIRRDTEKARAELSQTVETLRETISDATDNIRQRASPTAIKAEISDYITGRGREWLAHLKQHAMENPMQTVAIGATIAVPALKVVRSIPLPILLMGAGVALTSTRVRSSVAEAASPITEAAEAASQWAQSGSQTVKQESSASATEAGTMMEHTAEAAIEHVSNLAGKVRDRAAQLQDELAGQIGDKLDAASGTAKGAVEGARQQAQEIAAKMPIATKAIVGENSLVVGGIGLAIGALLAAALPATRQENEAFGDTSEQARQRVANLAETGLQKAKTAAMEVATEAVQKVAEVKPSEPLSGREQEAGEKLREVADPAVTTAFEPFHSPQR